MARPWALSCRIPRLHTARTTAVTTQTSRGRGAIRAPTVAQKPVDARLDGVVGRAPRPEDPATEDHQQRGQQRDHHQQADADADRGHRTEAGGGVHLGEDQAEHAEDDGERAGDDRRGRPVQREGHRLVPVLVPVQLFSIAGHEQQRVVGAGAEHQHREDARTLPVHGQVGVLGQQVDHAPGRRSAPRPPRSPAAATAAGCGRSAAG